MLFTNCASPTASRRRPSSRATPPSSKLMPPGQPCRSPPMRPITTPPQILQTANKAPGTLKRWHTTMTSDASLISQSSATCGRHMPSSNRTFWQCNQNSASFRQAAPLAAIEEAPLLVRVRWRRNKRNRRRTSFTNGSRSRTTLKFSPRISRTESGS